MECVQFYFRPNVTSSSRHIDIYAWIHNQEITVYSTRYKHRTWNHFCWIYSSNNGESKFYHNGVLVGMKTITALNDVYPTIKGDKAHEASAFIVGQEQDWIKSRYEPSQVYSGEITELNIWNVSLESSKITSLSSCKSSEKGNVVAWMKSNYKIHTSVQVIKKKDLNVLCEKTKEYIMFPEAVDLNNAQSLCHAQGGTIATPITQEENSQLMEIVQKHKSKCLAHSNPLQEGRSLWLGIKPINETVYYITNNKKNSSSGMVTSGYTNWDRYTPFYPNLGCSFLQNDGF
jgi:hypothetical protein